MTASRSGGAPKEGFIQEILGLPAEAFLSDVQEQAVRGPHRAAARVAAGVVAMADVDYLLNHAALQPSDVHIISGRAQTRDRRVFDWGGVPNAAYVYQQFLEGKTVRFHAAHRYLPRVAGFADDLSSALAVEVGANVYLSPEGGKGLDPHYDSHDVVVLQCVGAKRWRIYADFSPAAPLPRGKVLRFESGRYKPGRVDREIRMTAGDVLYIPRGVMHEAWTEEGDSLHATFSLNTPSLGELMIRALELAMEEDVELRCAVPWDMRVDPDAFDDSVAVGVAETLASGGWLKKAGRDYRDKYRKPRAAPAGHWFSAHGGREDGMDRLRCMYTDAVRRTRRHAGR